MNDILDIEPEEKALQPPGRCDNRMTPENLQNNPKPELGSACHQQSSSST